MIDRLNGDPEEFQRIWRDMLGIFGFMGEPMEGYLGAIAGEWWLKAHYSRRDRTPEVLEGRVQRFLQVIEARLETELTELVAAYRIMNRKWESNMEREIGTSGRVGVWHLRLAVETRLKTFQRLEVEGKLPSMSPLDQVLCQSVEDLDGFGEYV